MALPPIPTDFIAHWPGTIEGGQLIDETGNYPATITGGVTRGIGRIGEAMDCGQTGRGDAAIPALPNIVTWVGFARWDGASAVYLGGHSGSGKGLNISVRSTGEVQIYGWNSSVFIYRLSTGRLVAGEEHAIAIILNATDCTVDIYIDGNATSDISGGTATALPQSLSLFTTTKIGGWDSSSQHWDGWLNRIRIYPYALSPDQIKACALERPAIPTESLVAAYDFADMAAGVVPNSAPGADGSGDMTASGGVTKSGEIAGVGAALDGAPGTTLTCAIAGSSANNCTVSMFAKFSTISAQVLFAQDGVGQSKSSYRGLRISASGALQAFSRNAAESWMQAEGLTIQAGTTYHLALRQTAHILELFVNGSLNASVDLGSSATKLDYWTFGNYVRDGSAYFGGKMTAPKIYTTIASDSEIALLATERPAVPTLGLISRWTCDDIQGSTVIDEMGANNGTLIGDPTVVPGEVGEGIQFDGAGDRFSVTSPSFFQASTPRLIISTFVNAASPGVHGLFTADPDNTGARVHLAFPWSNNNVYCDFGNIGAGGRINGVWNAAWNNTTIHVLMVADESGLKLYIDGVLWISGGSAQAPNLSGKTLHFMYYPTGAVYKSGMLDQIAVYTETPSPLDILALANESQVYAIAGNVLEDGAPVIRTVRAYSSATGALLGETLSDANGDYSIPLGSDAAVLVMALGDTGYRPLVHGPVTID